HARALLPGRMAPAAIARILLVGIARIVDHDVGAATQLDDGLVGTVAAMLGIGDVADRLSAELDAIAGGPVGVIERCGAHGHVAAGERLAALELLERDPCLEDLERYRI